MSEVRIRYTKDGGYTYSLWRTISLGEVGEYQDRVRCRLRRIGMARTLAFEIEDSSTVPHDVIAMVAQIEGLGA